jgi:hypothetical protein
MAGFPKAKPIISSNALVAASESTVGISAWCFNMPVSYLMGPVSSVNECIPKSIATEPKAIGLVLTTGGTCLYRSSLRPARPHRAGPFCETTFDVGS